MNRSSRRRFLHRTGLTIAAGSVLAASGGGATAVASSARADSHDWPSLGGNPGNNPLVPTDPHPGETADVAWSYEHGEPGGYSTDTGALAVAGGTVLLTTEDGEVHAVDTADGSLEWRTDPIGATGTPAVIGDFVYVGGERLSKIDADTGQICCQTRLGYDEEIPSPTVADGIVFVVGDGVLYAIEASENAERWRFDPPGDPLYEQPVAVGDGAVIATSESRAFALELEDGTERWVDDASVGESDDVVFAGTNDRQTVFPVATDDLVAIGSVDREQSGMWPIGYTTLYDLETGEKRVVGESPSWDSGAITDERFYGLDSHNLRGYDQGTGEETWSTEVSTYHVSSVVVTEETVYAGLLIDGEAYAPEDQPEPEVGVYAFDAETGDVEWTVSTDGVPALALVDGTLYAASTRDVVAIRDESETDAGGDDSDDADDTDDEHESDEHSSDDTDTDSDSDSNDADGDDDTDTGTDDATDDDQTTTSTDDPASEGTASAGEETDDPTPGFTTGAGIAGGALTLEWLRRRVSGDEPE
ncbi:PQQ-binding-like beta-propeller repeat protein [Natronosalvus vescus]|uniref:outer membrane protein assembly factor BamB family protein n=1 Tax=Natronosalvus vescus TaxID=2953881 RepID=UPI002090B880|nr:PQQ-binding-like beta-propeller repeat protein [Natronosalvus vescus]